MTKRQYLRERPHKEDYFAAADEMESATLSLREMLDRNDSEVRSSEMAFGQGGGTQRRWESAMEAGSPDRPGH